MNQDVTELPDPRQSRAVLVGVANYERLSKLPAVGNNLSALADELRSARVWGLPRDNCKVKKDPTTAADMLDLVREAAANATDTLLFYYAGHGLVDRRSELHLALLGSDSDPARIYTAVPYDHIRDALLYSRTLRRIVILDCCYSGRALGQMADPLSAVVNQASAEGTYVLAATAENKEALARPGEQYTAFTAELLDIMRNGIPERGSRLALDSIYRQLLEVMSSKGLPLPQKSDRNTTGQLTLIYNQSFRQPTNAPVAVTAGGYCLMHGRSKIMM